MYKLVRPLLFCIDSETVHNQMLSLGVFLSDLGFGALLDSRYHFEHNALQTQVFGINFKNPVGPAAGFDKAGKLINLLPALGFSHVQVGDVSLLPWPGNPTPRLFRLVKDKGIINRLGQNNLGAETIASLLKSVKPTVPIAVSLVKTPDPKILGQRGVDDLSSVIKNWRLWLA